MGKVFELIREMQEAAEMDITLNCKGEPAIQKIRLLQKAMPLLRKPYLQKVFLENGLLCVLKTWLAPLPDRSMPPLQIRNDVLTLLLEFPGIDKTLLKESGLSKAVMYLHRHPKETPANKKRAQCLIDTWTRLIYNKPTDYKALSKEERLQRDLSLMPKIHEKKNTSENVLINDRFSTGGKTSHPCPEDKDWLWRARMPAVSNKAYIFRPKWQGQPCGDGNTKK